MFNFTKLAAGKVEVLPKLRKQPKKGNPVLVSQHPVEENKPDLTVL